MFRRAPCHLGSGDTQRELYGDGQWDWFTSMTGRRLTWRSVPAYNMLLYTVNCTWLSLLVCSEYYIVCGEYMCACGCVPLSCSSCGICVLFFIFDASSYVRVQKCIL